MTDPADYVRQVERYLCQKNKGHLIRVVGPAFDLVCAWVSRGVPLRVAFQGIDRCCQRHDARGPRRRPLRIEFCEQDVLDAFDDWRRAVGATSAAAPDAGETAAPSRKPALAAHVERAIARLANVRGTSAATGALQQHIDATIRELEEIAAVAVRARGDVRGRLVARLGELETQLMDAAVAALPAADSERLRSEASAELAPFGARMPADARARASEAAFRRLVRDAARLPTLAYE